MFLPSNRATGRGSMNRSVSGPHAHRRSCDHRGQRDTRFRLARIEQLESRELLSTLTVVNTNDSGSGSLRGQIAAAASGDKINFDSSLAGQTITLTSGQLTIGTSVQIVGPGASQLTISGNNASQVFYVNGGVTAAISGLTISGGNADEGGGIYNAGTLTITNSTVSGNSASSTVDFNAYTYGGGIYNAGTLTVTGSTVSGNSASSTCTYYYAYAYGGGIYNAGSLTVTDGTVSDNSVSASSNWFVGYACDYGGGIYSSGTLTVTGSTLSGNSAANSNAYGGGIWIDAGTATITGSTLSENSADYGGGIANNGTLTVTSDTLSGNSGDQGGGIYDRGTTTIADSFLSGNTASEGGGIFIEYGTLTITDSTLSGNSATSYGGGIANWGGLTITHCTLSGNSATGTYGGGIYDAGTLTITDSTLSGNSASSTSSYAGGGGIWETGTLTITNSTISGNSAVGCGGIYNSGTTTITGCTLSENSATSSGGIGNGGTLTITDSTVSGNSATGSPSYGGGISNSGTLTVTNDTLSGNSAAYGGGISTTSGTLTITGSTLSGNSASTQGGGIYIDAGPVTITDSTLSGNSATDGGGIFNLFLGTLLTITDSTVSGNSATGGYGGGLANVYGTLTLNNSIVANNTGSTQADVYQTPLDGSLTVNSSLIQDEDMDGSFSGSGNIFNQDPFMAPLGNYGGPTQTMALLPGSPAIDSGDNDLIPTGVTTDQRGCPRIVNGTVDMGAFEVGSASFVLAPASGLRYGTTTLSATLTVDTVPIPGQTITFSEAGQPLGTATTNSQGVAMLSGVSLASFTPGSYVTGAAIGSGPIAATGTLTVLPDPASKLVFVQQPLGALAKASINPAVQVAVEDVYGNVETIDNTDAITVAIGTNPAGGKLGGTTTATVVAGVATFRNLSINNTGKGYTLKATATSGTLTQATSTSFNITNAASKLVFLQQPTTVTAGASISPAVKVAIEDSSGNILTADYSDKVTMAFGKNAGSGTLGGTTTGVTVSGGVATFGGLWIDKAGTGYTLAATSGSLSKATSSSFTVSPGAASRLAFQQQPAASAVAGASIGAKVAIEDSFGNILTSDKTDQVTVAIAGNPGGGTLHGTTTVTVSAGVATVSQLWIDKVGVAYSLQATSGKLQATSTSFNITPGSASKVVFLQRPTNAAAGVSISPAVTVEVQDAYGNALTADKTDKITVAIATNPASGKLGGTTTATVVAGVATFGNLSINKIGTGYTLAATSGKLTKATSAAFNITTAAKAVFASIATGEFSPSLDNAGSGGLLSLPLDSNRAGTNYQRSVDYLMASGQASN